MDSGTPTVRRCRAAYAALQFAYWVNGSILIGFLLPYLHGLGFRDDTAGFLMAGVSLLGFLLPFLISSLSERLGLRLLPLLRGLLTVQLALCLLLLPTAADRRGLPLCLLLTGLHMSIYPLYVTLATELRRKLPLRFSVARAVGSLGYALMSLLLGTAAAASDRRIGLVCACVSLGFQLLLLQAFRDCLAGETEGENDRVGGSGAQGAKAAPFLLLLLGAALIFSGDSAVNSFRYSILLSLGGSLGAFGLLTAFKGLMEIPVMLLYPALRRLGSGRLLTVAMCVFLVKLALVRLAGSVGMLYAAFALQAFSFGLYAPAIVDFLDEISPKAFAARAQSLGNGMNTFGAFGATVLTGCLLSEYSVSASLNALLLLEALGLAFYFAGRQKLREFFLKEAPQSDRMNQQEDRREE